MNVQNKSQPREGYFTEVYLSLNIHYLYVGSNLSV